MKILIVTRSIKANLFLIQQFLKVKFDCTMYICKRFLVFQTKTGLPETLQEQWQDKPGGFGRFRSLHYHVRKYYLLPNFLSDKEKREYLNSYKMVTYGRHPFVRLVSTYKDKVIDHKVGIGLKWKIMMKYDKNHPYSVN